MDKEINHEKCVDKIRHNLIKHNDTIKYAIVDLCNIVSWNGNKRNKYKKTGQRVRIVYTHTKKNGEKVEKSDNTFVAHQYCPFCGKKFKNP